MTKKYSNLNLSNPIDYNNYFEPISIQKGSLDNLSIASPFEKFITPQEVDKYQGINV
jgi:hypothetical protein